MDGPGELEGGGTWSSFTAFVILHVGLIETADTGPGSTFPAAGSALGLLLEEENVAVFYGFLFIYFSVTMSHTGWRRMSWFPLAASAGQKEGAPSNLVGQREGRSRESQVLFPGSVSAVTAAQGEDGYGPWREMDVQEGGMDMDHGERRVCSEERWTLCLGSGCQPWDHVWGPW